MFLQWNINDLSEFMCKFIKNRTERTFHVRIWLTRRRLLVGVLLVRLVDGAFAGDVQSRIDDFRDRLNLGAQLLFDAMKIETIFVRDEIDGNTWKEEGRNR